VGVTDAADEDGGRAVGVPGATTAAAMGVVTTGVREAGRAGCVVGGRDAPALKSRPVVGREGTGGVAGGRLTGVRGVATAVASAPTLVRGVVAAARDGGLDAGAVGAAASGVTGFRDGGREPEATTGSGVAGAGAGGTVDSTVVSTVTGSTGRA
jgi:hypothetical protein